MLRFVLVAQGLIYPRPSGENVSFVKNSDVDYEAKTLILGQASTESELRLRTYQGLALDRS